MLEITPQGMVIGRPVISGTSGSILFVDSNGNLAQNNSNLFWDNTNNRLGIGTVSPSQKLHVNGNAVVNDGGVSITSSQSGPVLFVTGNSSTSQTVQAVWTGSDSSSNTVFELKSNANYRLFVRASGAVNIPAGPLAVGTISGAVSMLDVNGGVSVGTYAATNAAPSNGMIISGNVGIGTTGPNAALSVFEKFQVNSSGLIPLYNNVATTGWGVPAIYKSDRATAQAAAKSLAAYTVGSSDGSFLISANVLITTSTLFNFTVTCTYTDEGNTSRTLTIPFTNLAGTALTGITNSAGAVPYEGIPQHIRCKASTTITIATTGTFTTVTYNVEEMITQIA